MPNPHQPLDAEWMPIESAPKNGVRFLAFVEGHVRVVAWGKTSHIPIYGFCLADQGVEDFDICEPTHWMPLPKPPWSSALSKRGKDAHDALRACILCYGRKVDQYVDKSDGTTVSIWHYDGEEYEIRSKPKAESSHVV